MSFEPPAGILDIGNATLRVGKLEVAETTGLNQGLQNVIKNDLLVTENTTYTTNQKWGIKLPTTWVAEFEVKGHSGKYIDFNFYNENSVSNAQGYNLTFMDTTMTLKYDNGSALGGGAVTIPTIVGTYRKVHIFFERNVIAVSIDGTRYLYDKRPSVLSRVISATGSAFVNLFIEADGDDSAFKNLRIVNGRFISDETSNIAFVGGNLGVGVHSPQEALDIRGNMHFNRVSNVSQVSVDSNVVTEYTGPHERPLRKYPEVALTADDNLSTSGYKASVSSLLTGNNGFRAFDATEATSYWHSQHPYYTNATGTYNPGQSAGGTGTPASGTTLPTTQLIPTSRGGDSHQGEWIKLQMPKKIKLEEVRVYASSRVAAGTNVYQMPEDIAIAGSNDGTNWYLVDSGTLRTDIRESYGMTSLFITTSSYYSHLALIVKSIDNQGNNFSAVEIANIEYYGREEGDASLDTTLKTVYNVPTTTGTQLEVYYDAKDLTTMPNNVTDLSPNSHNGSVTGVTLDETDGIKSFKFNGSSQYVTGAHGLTTGSDPVHTISLWLNATELTNYAYAVQLGQGGTSHQQSAIMFYENKISHAHWGSGVLSEVTITTNEWYHVVAVFTGGNGSYLSNHKIFINGEDRGVGPFPGSTDGAVVLTGTQLTLGRKEHAGGTPGNYFNGSIANFRLYSKALNADQVKELYDYQKDYFFGSKSQVTLYKGHLGIGVTEPSGQLELAGDERLQEYPPGPMDGYETLIPGHGVFCVYGSSVNSSYYPWKAFDNNDSNLGWHSLNSKDSFDGTNNAYIDRDGSSMIGNYKGGWLKLKLPYKIELKSFSVRNRSDGSTNLNSSPEDFVIIGSNDDKNWDELFTITGVAWASTQLTKIYSIKSNPKTYRYLAFVCTRTVATGSVIIGHLKFFGIPAEPTALDKGSLSLTRSLGVPRVSRYDVDLETPRPDRLLVNFDTTVNRYPIDISGNFRDGVMTSGFSYSVLDKAFEGQASTTGRIEVTGVPTTTGSGNFKMSVSMWFKLKTIPASGTSRVLWGMVGENDGTDGSPSSYASPHAIVNASGNISWAMWGNDIYNQTAIVNNRWYHCVWTYDGGTTGRKMFLDGVEQTFNTAQTAALNMVNATSRLTIGIYPHDLATSVLDGYVSNFKLHDVALEVPEVMKLYNMDRTGRSMVISDTAVGIGKAPEAQLDVSGVTRFDGRVGIGTNVPHFPLHVRANGEGVQAVYHSQWINWLTNPNYNNVYNGDSPSYPNTTHPASNTTSLYCRHSIGCSGYLWSAGNVLNMSDRRIKTNIVDANDDTCLRTLRELKPKKYNYKDVRERGAETVWGFIAQEVKETLPYSTTLKTEYLPNIQEKARILDDGKTIVFTDFNTASLESNATTIQITDKSDVEHDVTLTEILGPHTIRIKEDITEHSFTYDQPDDEGNMIEGNYVYMHGQKVDDFVYLRKDAIWTITTAALQEVDRQLQFERARNDAIEARLTALEQAKYM